jgi:competence protein ComEA
MTMNTTHVRASLTARVRHILAIAAIAALLAAGGASWLSPRTAAAGPKTLPAARAPADTPRTSPVDDEAPVRRGKKAVTGKLNLNTATVDQLMLLPGVGPSKAERVVAWRSKHGPFKRVADLRKVKGFGYKTLKKLEANLDIKGDSTLRPTS